MIVFTLYLIGSFQKKKTPQVFHFLNVGEMNNNYDDEDDNNSAMGCVDCFVCSPLWVGSYDAPYRTQVDPF